MKYMLLLLCIGFAVTGKLNAQTPPYHFGDNGHLFVQAESEFIDVGIATSVVMALDSSAIAWTTEEEDGSANIYQYKFEVGKIRRIYSEARQNNAVASLRLITYNEGLITFEINGDSRRIDPRLYYEGHSPEETHPAPVEMPLYFYQYGKFGATFAWDMQDDVLFTDGGGEAGFSPNLFSPDGNFNLTVITPPTYYRVVLVLDSHSLERVTAPQFQFSNRYLQRQPIWRWDSKMISWIEAVDEEGATAELVQMDPLSGETTILFDDLPTGSNSEKLFIPQLLWWTPDVVIMRYSADGIKQEILVYSPDGEILHTRLFSDIDAESDSQVSHILPTISGEIGLFYPEQQKWRLFNPLSGELDDLAEDQWIIEVPQTNPLETRYGRIILPEGGDRIVELAGNGDVTVIENTTMGGLSVAPDGLYYSYLTNESLLVGGTEDYFVSETDPFGIAPDSVSWSPVIGRIVRIIGTGESE